MLLNDNLTLYNAIGYIREKSQQVGQVFVFTHKFALLKDFSMMFGDHQTNQYIIQRAHNSPVLVNLDNLISQYHDEYAYLFKKIYEFVKNPPSDTSEYLQYPNMARRVLEGFLTFKLPSSKTMIDKILELENNRETSAARSIMRLINNHSHLKVIPRAELSDDIDSISALPDTLNNLMEFIKYHDNRHYDTLAFLCDPEYDKDGDAVTVIRIPSRIIKFFPMSASAGFGNFLEENPEADDYETTNQNCTFAVRIEGDSMEPDVHNGDIVLVKECEEVPNARKGIVWYSERVIKLPLSVYQVLAERKKVAQSEWIFPHPKDMSKPMPGDIALKRLRKILESAGLPHIRFHDLRHTFATHAVSAGIDPKTLSSILGHSKASFSLDRYGHVTAEMQKGAAKTMGRFFDELVGEEVEKWQKAEENQED